jgi:hypothetical protein
LREANLRRPSSHPLGSLDAVLAPIRKKYGCNVRTAVRVAVHIAGRRIVPEKEEFRSRIFLLFECDASRVEKRQVDRAAGERLVPRNGSNVPVPLETVPAAILDPREPLVRVSVPKLKRHRRPRRTQRSRRLCWRFRW